MCVVSLVPNSFECSLPSGHCCRSSEGQGEESACKSLCCASHSPTLMPPKSTASSQMPYRPGTVGCRANQPSTKASGPSAQNSSFITSACLGEGHTKLLAWAPRATSLCHNPAPPRSREQQESRPWGEALPCFSNDTQTHHRTPRNEITCSE